MLQNVSAEDSQNPTAGKVRRILVAFAGGGAKALIHVGALKALEERGVEFIGVAGTSAGAIVAALKAAGLNADDLMNASTKTTLLGRLHEIDPKIRKAVDLFGTGGWGKIRVFRRFVSSLLGAITVLGFILLVSIFLSGWLITPQHVFLGWLCAIVLIVVAILAVRYALGGLADKQRFCRALGILLQRRMFPNEPGRVVRMSDFGRDGRPTLKIVSANLSRRRLHLFSPTRTPNVAVADAVAASVSLPIIFVPQFIGEDLHMDGGIVSNLPAWPFDEERELDPEATTIAIEIAQATERLSLSRYNWLTAFITTGLFGSGELNLRISGEAERLELTSSLNLLEFDLTVAKAFQEVEDARRAASVRLDKRLFRRPDLYRDACSVTQSLVDDVLETISGAAGRTRVAVAVQDRGYTQSLRLRFAIGYDDDQDEGMLLPLVGTVAGVAWNSGESQFEVAPLPPDLRMPGEANRVRRKATRRDIEWVLAIPIYDKKAAAPRFVVQIDGSKKLAGSADVETAITQIEAGVKEFFSMITEQLSDLEDDNGVEE